MEAVLAFAVATVSSGVVVGYGAATHPELASWYGFLAPGLVLGPVALGHLTDRLLDSGAVPAFGASVDAPDDATTGFYAVAVAVMAAGSLVEVATGSPNPVYLAVLVAGSIACFERGLRRGLHETPSLS